MENEVVREIAVIHHIFVVTQNLSAGFAA